jgi:hypothetical protein
MKKLLSVWLGAMLLCAAAQAATIRTSVAVGYETGFFSRKPSDDTLRKAEPLIRDAVWKKYLTRLSPEARELVMARQADVTARMVDLISSLRVTSTEVDESSRTMYFEVEAVVDDNLLNVILKGSATRSGAGSLTGFLILPRLQSSATAFETDARRSANADASATTERVTVDEVQETDKGTTERQIQGNKASATAQTRTSGTTTRQSQKANWTLGNARDVDAAINRFLGGAGFETVTYADFAADCGGPPTEDVRADLLASASAELSDDIRRQAFRAARDCEFKYFVVGTLDVDSLTKDPNSDNVQARANVSIKVYDVSARFPRSVVSIGPVAYRGVGQHEDAATTDALVKSAREAAQNIVQQLRLKGLR